MNVASLEPTAFTNTGLREQPAAHRPDPNELACVPDEEVATTWTAALGEATADGRGEEERHREQLGWDAPFQAAAGADEVDQNVVGIQHRRK